MNIHTVILVSQWFFLSYMLTLTGFYTLLMVSSYLTIQRHRESKDNDDELLFDTGLELPISLISPAYNEEKGVVASVKSLLQVAYPTFEVIVINDGSTDNTLEALIEAFELIPFPETFEATLKTQPIRAIYRSGRHPNLKVVDKMNGGKADALNAGINVSQYPLFCGMDADTILPSDSLNKIIRPFLTDPLTIASGGIVRIINGCSVKSGHLHHVGLPRNVFAMMQVLEYTRAFLFGRIGWDAFNGVLVISGAYGVFDKQTVMNAGGYLTSTIGEDMELVIRLHRYMRERHLPYRIRMVPDPICWTEAPEDMVSLRNQRIRWQRGLGESLSRNVGLMFSRNGGFAGWVTFPFLLIYELLGPLIELLGLMIMLLCVLSGAFDATFASAFLIMSLGLALFMSSAALFLEEMAYASFKSFGNISLVFCGAVLESFLFRQLNNYWRTVGLFKWLFNSKSSWGHIVRKGVDSPRQIA